MSYLQLPPRNGMGVGIVVPGLVMALRAGRKVNDSVAAEKTYRRYELARDECRRRGVRFLPAQVLRPIYASAGVL